MIGGGEDVGFHVAHAIDPPGEIDQRLDELLFDGALGLGSVEPFLGVTEESEGVFVRKQDGLRVESMTEGVEAGFLFALWGLGACRVLRIGLVCGGLIYGCHTPYV